MKSGWLDKSPFLWTWFIYYIFFGRGGGYLGMLEFVWGRWTSADRIINPGAKWFEALWHQFSSAAINQMLFFTLTPVFQLSSDRLAAAWTRWIRFCFFFFNLASSVNSSLISSFVSLKDSENNGADAEGRPKQHLQQETCQSHHGNGSAPSAYRGHILVFLCWQWCWNVYF